MQDRTQTLDVALATAPIPMPGRLPVEYYDDLLRARTTKTLTELRDDTHVTATGTITHVRHLDPRRPARVQVVLTDDTRNSALVEFDPDHSALVWPLLVAGTRITVAGIVTRRAAGQAPFLLGSNARLDEADAAAPVVAA